MVRIPHNQEPFCGALASYKQETGVEIFTFFAATYCIRFRPSEYRKSQRRYVFYGGVLLALVTIEVASRSLWGQYMWIDHRNYPGGPLGYYAASESSWYNVLGIGAGAMANTLSDGLLVCPS